MFWKKSNRAYNAHRRHQSKEVGDFYDLRTNDFLHVYGEVIQAFRTNDVNEWLAYTAQSMDLHSKTTALDAGCGVCGPARYYAKHFAHLQIEACSISANQVGQARQKNVEAGLQQQIQVQHLDYHNMANHYPASSFDLVYFLESFGHSSQQTYLLKQVFTVLKEGGALYIKDLFKALDPDEWKQQRIDEICQDINKAYYYNIPSLGSFLDAARKIGFRLEWVRVPQIKLETFEHLKISNDFQELFNVGKINSWADYIFPIDFYELMLTKPVAVAPEELHKYFMNTD